MEYKEENPGELIIKILKFGCLSPILTPSYL